MNNGERKRSAGANLALLGLGVIGGYAAWRFTQKTRIEIRNQHLQRGRKIVILGAGFGGRHAALELARQLPQEQDGEIILVDQEPFLLFTPMLTEAAGGEDFLIDDHDWRIRYLEINTGHWWAGRKILVSPEWISAIDWQQSTVRVDLDRETIKGAPEYEPRTPVDREYEARLHEYYQRAPYWNQRMAA